MGHFLAVCLSSDRELFIDIGYLLHQMMLLSSFLRQKSKQK
jgi:hypothetical protein